MSASDIELATAEVTASMQGIIASAQSLAQGALQLQGEVGRFKFSSKHVI